MKATEEGGGCLYQRPRPASSLCVHHHSGTGAHPVGPHLRPPHTHTPAHPHTYSRSRGFSTCAWPATSPAYPPRPQVEVLRVDGGLSCLPSPWAASPLFLHRLGGALAGMRRLRRLRLGQVPPADALVQVRVVPRKAGGGGGGTRACACCVCCAGSVALCVAQQHHPHSRGTRMSNGGAGGPWWPLVAPVEGGPAPGRGPGEAE